MAVMQPILSVHLISITPSSNTQLHWLPVEPHIAYKMRFHCFNFSSSQHVQDELLPSSQISYVQLYPPSQPNHSSTDTKHLTSNIPTLNNLTKGDHAFSHAIANPPV